MDGDTNTKFIKPINQKRFNGSHTPNTGRKNMLAKDHPAVVASKSKYSNITDPTKHKHKILKSGKNSKKTGRMITKGRWQGFPIYTLTLEERATCPTTCPHWRDCYGNSMHWAVRFQHGADLEGILEYELAELQELHPKGFSVRLHILGDFYSETYLLKWLGWLDDFPALHIFGFTAHPVETYMGQIIELAQKRIWKQFAIRFSNQVGPKSSIVILKKEDLPPGVTICPAQLSNSECCATCTFCWATTKPIAFLKH